MCISDENALDFKENGVTCIVASPTIPSPPTKSPLSPPTLAPSDKITNVSTKSSANAAFVHFPIPPKNTSSPPPSPPNPPPTRHSFTSRSRLRIRLLLHRLFHFPSICHRRWILLLLHRHLLLAVVVLSLPFLLSLLPLHQSFFRPLSLPKEYMNPSFTVFSSHTWGYFCQQTFSLVTELILLIWWI